MKKGLIKLLPVAAVFILAGIVFIFTGRKHNSAELAFDSSYPEQDQEVYYNDVPENILKDEDIWVHVSGAVSNPGVYCLPYGSRVFEAVEMAGGVTSQACLQGFNLAQVLSDSSLVCVPFEQETVSSETGSFLPVDDGLININTASVQELISLPGIGEARAQAIIEYRQHSPFLRPEDIMNVSGIKQNSFEKIKDRIKV